MTSRQGPLRYPPLNALRMFESAARHLNFRVASEELGVTQGAVAQQIRALEQDLKVKLFERLPRSLALTDAGRIYLSPVRRALKLISEATEELRPQKTVLSLSVTSSFATKWLIPRLGKFTDLNPDLEVQILATNGLSNFQSDGVDLAVRHAMPPFSSGLRADLLFPLQLSAVCSPHLLKTRDQFLTPEDFGDQVLLHDGHGFWPLFLHKAGVEISLNRFKSQKFSHESFAIDAAIAGQGIALANEVLIKDDLIRGTLVRALDYIYCDDYGFFIVSPREPRKASQVQIMRNWLLSEADMFLRDKAISVRSD